MSQVMNELLRYTTLTPAEVARRSGFVNQTTKDATDRDE